MIRAHRILSVAAVITMFTSACSPNDLVSSSSPKISKRQIQPDCQAGCQIATDDPNPDSVGVWMGSDFTPETCFGDYYDDNDHDGMGDQCEWALAKRFAPIMTFEDSDPVGREPYWVARGASGLVTIGYFMAYYIDLGCTQYLGCGNFSPEHFGDSEAIRVDLWYNSASQHWIAYHVMLSEHTGYAEFGGATDYVYAPGLEYPSELGGPFRVHASFGKHANYATRSACNNFSDQCNNASGSGDTLYVGSERNLGSYSYPFRDCVYSEVGQAFDDYQECFWTGWDFAGWLGMNNGPDFPPFVYYSKGYWARLEDFGFLPL